MAPELPPEEFYSKHAERQAEERREEVFGPQYRIIRDRFLSNVPGKRVLDAGCGHGRDTDYFVRQGFEAIGIDIASEIIDYARNNKKGDFHVMDMRDLAFEDDQFDAVWASTSLFFMQRQGIEKALKECHRVLIQNGILQANFKKGNGSYKKERWGDAITEYHFQDYEIREMLESAGFRVNARTTNESVGGSIFLNYLCRKD